MKTIDSLEKLVSLRAQIEKDYRVWPDELDRQKESALAVLNQVAGEVDISPEAIRTLAELKRSVEDFYNPLMSRGWTQQFAIKDIQKLEAIFRKGESDTAYFRRLKRMELQTSVTERPAV